VANIKITDLVTLTEPVSTDVLPIVDVSLDVTKKISIAELLRTAGLGSQTDPGISFDGDTDTGVYSPGANQLAFTTNGSEALRITSDGKVGIGTTNPQAALNINAAASTSPFISSINSSEAARIDSSGRLLVGTSSSRTNFYNGSNTAQIQLEGTNFQNAAFAITCNANSADKGGLIFAKSRGTTVGSNTVVQAGDDLGAIEFQGADGSQFVSGANIKAEVDGIPDADDMPSRLVFSTTADGASSPTERLRITSDGKIGIGVTDPSAFLEVKGGANNTAARELIAFGRPDSAVSGAMGTGVSTGNGVFFGATTNHPLALLTNNTERLRIDESGLVGIGTTDPSNQLHVVAQNSPANTSAKFESLTNNSYINFVDPLGATFIGNNGNETKFLQGAGASEAMRINSDGNVGIGTTDPATKLVVADAAPVLRLLSTSTVPATENLLQAIEFFQSDVSGGQGVSAKISGIAANLSGAMNLAFSTGDAANLNERMRINAAGDVGIGTTSPGKRLEVVETTNDTEVARFTNTGGTSGSISGKGYVGFALFQLANPGAYIGWDQDGPSGFQTEMTFGTRGNSDVFPSERMRITSDGFVGIGTTAPGAKLEVKGNATGTAVQVEGNANSDYTYLQTRNPSGVQFQFVANANGDAQVRGVSNHPVSFYTNNTEKMRITTDGKVGIGTTAPGRNLTVDGGTGTIIAAFQSTGTGCGFGLKDATTSADNTVTIRAIGNDLVSHAGGQERMRITSDGLVGIGTSSPGDFNSLANRLVVNTSGSDSGITVASGGSSTGNIYFADASTGLAAYRGIVSYDHLDNSLRLGTNAIERVRIDSDGRLLVAASSARTNYFNATTYAPQLQVEGGRGISITRTSVDSFSSPLILAKTRNNAIIDNNDEIGGLSFQGDDGTNFVEAASIEAYVDGTPGADDMPGRLVFSTTADGASSPTERMRIRQNGSIDTITDSGFSYFVRNKTTTAGNVIFGCLNGASVLGDGTTVFLVRGDGDCENTNNSYGAISDIKLKENIVDAGSQWNDLRALQIRKYNFKSETGYGTHTQIGLVAQEVELVSPGLVSESPDRDDEGNDLGTVTKSVNYSVLYMKAVKALQEAMERIETLEQRLTDAGI